MASLTDPVFVAGVALGACGLALLAQARMQSRLLRRRVASGAGTLAIDGATGLFGPDAAWQCVRAEANRATRLQRPLDLWVGTATDEAELDALGRELAFSLPGGALGVRLGRHQVCVMTCADVESPTRLVEEIEWQQRRVPPGEDAAHAALAFVAGAAHG